MSNVDAALWRDMMDYLHRQHAPLCRQWFEHLRPGELNGGLLTIHTTSAIQRNYLQSRCIEQFTEAAQSATGALVTVKFVDGQPALEATAVTARPATGHHANEWVTPPPPHADSSHTGTPAHPAHAPRPVSQHDDGDWPYDQIVISPDYSFDHFVTGPENALAYSAAVAVAKQPGTDYNPLFIHGGVGLGKTHLLQAICQSVLEINPTMRICYLSCDAFVNQYMEGIQHRETSRFRQRYRHVDLLVIDDIHFLANRERTQEEFFHTFNELYQLKRQIVLSSDSPPGEIPQLEDRLVSRFQSGMVAPVSQPHYETRVAIVRAKAAVRGMELPDDVVSYIATRIASNARELEGAITTLQGYASLRSGDIDLPLAQQALGDDSDNAPVNQITLQQVIDAVTSFYNVRLSDLQSKRRHKSITGPRQVCMWLARRHTRFSLEEIGGYFGGRDHTTVMHSLRTVDQNMAQDAEFARQVEHIEASVIDSGQAAGR